MKPIDKNSYADHIQAAQTLLYKLGDMAVCGENEVIDFFPHPENPNTTDADMERVTNLVHYLQSAIRELEGKFKP